MAEKAQGEPKTPSDYLDLNVKEDEGLINFLNCENRGGDTLII